MIINKICLYIGNIYNYGLKNYYYKLFPYYYNYKIYNSKNKKQINSTIKIRKCLELSCIS